MSQASSSTSFAPFARGGLPALALLGLAACVTDDAAEQERVAFQGPTIWSADLDAPVENGVLLVEEGRVVDLFSAGSQPIPDGYEVVDLGEGWLIPGLVNAHGHVREEPGFDRTDQPDAREAVRAQLALYARYGVTSVFSMGGEPVEAFALRDASDTPDHRVARLLVAGPIAAAQSAEEAPAAVDASLEPRPDYLKIRVDSFLGSQPKMPRPAYAALIEEAAEHDLIVSAHIVDLEDGRALLTDGAGLLAHSVRDHAVDAAFVALMAETGVCLTPTLTREVSTYVYADRPAFFDDPWFLREAAPALIEALLEPEFQAGFTGASADWYREALPTAVDNMMAIHRGGGTIAMGTDTGVFGRFQGYFEQVEMEMMQEAGMSAPEVLRASTLDAARCLDQDHRVGSLQPGRWADFIVLDENPLETVEAVRSLRAVYIGGQPLP